MRGVLQSIYNHPVEYEIFIFYDESAKNDREFKATIPHIVA